MSRNKVNKGHSVPAFVDKFSVQLDRFGLKLRETASIGHRGSKGSEREVSVREFFQGLLPTIYEVCTGEVVDLHGMRSPQLDVLIYDKTKNFPLFKGDASVLPAEALLSSVESKSLLNSSEVERCVNAAKALKSLKPMKKPLATHAGALEEGQQRYYHAVFAFESDLSEDEWALKEVARFDQYGHNCEIDLLYVLGRGLINFQANKWMPEDSATSHALVAFFFSIYNFIVRENRRRDPAPYFSYASDLNRHWRKIRT